MKRREAGSVPHDEGSVAGEAAGSGADGTDDAGRRKKLKAGPGSRGVANLTPEQLAKKRANGTAPSSHHLTPLLCVFGPTAAS